MTGGLLAGLLWGLDTVILGIALAQSKFVSTQQAVFLAPFVSTFLHDFASACWMLLYMGFKKQYRQVLNALKTPSGKYIMLGALSGGPIGMSRYLAAIQWIGPGYTAVISAMFPAVGALLSYLILKEKMRPAQLAGLFACICGVIGLSYTNSGKVEHFFAGILCALLCVAGWALEAVICAYGMKTGDVSHEQALQIRQITSAAFYGIFILTALKGWRFTMHLVPTNTSAIIALAALCGTASYLAYYRAIKTIGAAKAMSLDITYSAWALFFGWMLLGAPISTTSFMCAAVVIAGSILAASDRQRPMRPH